MADISRAIDELLKFSSGILELNEGIIEEKIGIFEKEHNLALPADYKTLLRKTNGLSLMGTIVYGIFDNSVFSSLGGSYKFEYFEVENEMPENLVPFSPDGAGNHYCFDVSVCDTESCKVVFWRHDVRYGANFSPEIVNDSFSEWAKEVLIDWTLEDYDYSGKRK